MNPISVHRSEIRKLCQQFGVSELFAFGSVLGDHFTDSSDIDLIVKIDDLDPLTYSDKYFNLKFRTPFHASLTLLRIVITVPMTMMTQPAHRVTVYGKSKAWIKRLEVPGGVCPLGRRFI